MAAVTLLLTACGTAVPDTDEVALPDGWSAGATGDGPEATPPSTPTEPTEEPTTEPTEEPTTEPTEEPTTEPTEEPTGTGDAGAGACSSLEEIDYEAGSPGDATWGDPVEAEDGDSNRFGLEAAEPKVSEATFAMPGDPAFVWESDVTATHVSGMGYTSIVDFVLLDSEGNQCEISWGDTTLWGLMVFEKGDEESGVAAFQVPTDDPADYELVWVGGAGIEAQWVWKP